MQYPYNLHLIVRLLTTQQELSQSETNPYLESAPHPKATRAAYTLTHTQPKSATTPDAQVHQSAKATSRLKPPLFEPVTKQAASTCQSHHLRPHKRRLGQVPGY